jgi:hypothetical protein
MLVLFAPFFLGSVLAVSIKGEKILILFLFDRTSTVIQYDYYLINDPAPLKMLKKFSDPAYRRMQLNFVILPTKNVDNQGNIEVKFN